MILKSFQIFKIGPIAVDEIYFQKVIANKSAIFAARQGGVQNFFWVGQNRSSNQRSGMILGVQFQNFGARQSFHFQKIPNINIFCENWHENWGPTTISTISKILPPYFPASEMCCWILLDLLNDLHLHILLHDIITVFMMKMMKNVGKIYLKFVVDCKLAITDDMFVEYILHSGRILRRHFW